MSWLSITSLSTPSLLGLLPVRFLRFNVSLCFHNAAVCLLCSSIFCRSTRFVHLLTRGNNQLIERALNSAQFLFPELPVPATSYSPSSKLFPSSQYSRQNRRLSYFPITSVLIVVLLDLTTS